jgi:nitrile hydratase subunit beta
MSLLFRPGERVRVGTRELTGHYRTPVYLQGKRGVVLQHLGDFRNPEELAYHRPGLPPLALYQVEFAFDEVWPHAREPGATRIIADIYQHWLEREENT